MASSSTPSYAGGADSSPPNAASFASRRLLLVVAIRFTSLEPDAAADAASRSFSASASFQRTACSRDESASFWCAPTPATSLLASSARPKLASALARSAAASSRFAWPPDTVPTLARLMGGISVLGGGRGASWPDDGPPVPVMGAPVSATVGPAGTPEKEGSVGEVTACWSAFNGEIGGEKFADATGGGEVGARLIGIGDGTDGECTVESDESESCEAGMEIGREGRAGGLGEEGSVEWPVWADDGNGALIPESSWESSCAWVDPKLLATTMRSVC